MSERRVGLLGGTFDPIHIGHLLAAERALEAARLDEVRFMPTFRPPHKAADRGASPEDRRRMTELAIEGHPSFRLETIELERGGVSYAVDTAAALKAREPEHDFYWIIGGDMALYLPQWHAVGEIVRHVTFLGLTRPGYPVDREAIPPYLRGRVQFAEMPGIDVSSTDIRERCRLGRSIRYAVPEPVRRYIAEKGLYRDANANDDR